MCGIIGYTGKEEASDIIFHSLQRLEYRGYDSAGLSVMDCQGEFNTVKTTNRVASLIEKTDNGNKTKGQTGIGHTRWATHGEVSETNAHPHLSGKFAVVHNGIIENYIELKKQLENQGYVFKSETDTEVVPLLLSYNYHGDFMDSVRKTVSALKGSFALAIMCKDFPDTLIAVRNFSPLIIGLGENGNFAASDITAIGSFTENIIYMEDGEIALITPKSIDIYGKDGQAVKKQIKKVSADNTDVGKDGYAHYMLKEIFEQPKAFSKTAEHYIKNDSISHDSIGIEQERLKAFDKIHIVACGSAYHAGLASKYVFEELNGIPVYVQIASEYRYEKTPIDSKTLFIAISQSGETADTIAALTLAKEKCAYTVAVVNVKNSTLSRICHTALYTLAGPEISVATTKGYTSQLCVLYILALFLGKNTGMIDSEQEKDLVNEIKKLPFAMAEILERSEEFKKLSFNTPHLFFMGRNTDYAISLEASLKLKEISYINSTAYAAGELKHGTISLIEKGTVVFAICCNERLKGKTESNIKEVKSRGAYVMIMAQYGNREAELLGEKVLYVPKVNTLFSPCVHIIPLQLFAYYTALELGCDIDKPKNLAKSVTVE
ncbi:MAG: glutamine--fructose-6-phosphate transaminase (isomerizing) [Acutalibacteraceae bacterium]|nr:glutamine--fructose-6-phosphate transaminase (isomerizing) [Acutalibacteraceae bacterium]